MSEEHGIGKRRVGKRREVSMRGKKAGRCLEGRSDCRESICSFLPSPSLSQLALIGAAVRPHIYNIHTNMTIFAPVSLPQIV